MERLQPLEPYCCDDSDLDDDIGALDSDSADEWDNSDEFLLSSQRATSPRRGNSVRRAVDTFNSEMEAELMAGVTWLQPRAGLDIDRGAFTNAAPVESAKNSATEQEIVETRSNNSCLHGDADMMEMSVEAENDPNRPPADGPQQYDAIYFDSDEDEDSDDEKITDEPACDTGALTSEKSPANDRPAQEAEADVTAAPSSEIVCGAAVKNPTVSARKRVRFACPSVRGCGVSRSRGRRGRSSAGVGRRATARDVVSNDDLLYDPDMDESDQAWVNSQRLSYQPCGLQQQQQRRQSRRTRDDHGAASLATLPATDAVLNCPGCMSMLCLDSQRHELYRNQYRAMFVFNCSVRHNESMQYRLPKKQRARDFAQTSSCSAAREVYRPVNCCMCKTDVAVFDQDEVYHFFNVISSHA